MKMFAFKISFICVLISAIMVAAVFSADMCVGCIKELENDKLDEAKSTLENSLTKLAAGDGPVYRLVKINSASVQIVSGTLHRINADLEDGDKKVKTCDIEIWSQSWLENGNQVTFNCPGEEKLVKKHD